MPAYNATTIPNLNRALKALSREELQQFADRVFTILYLECEHPKKRMEVNPDKEWDQSAIEEVDTALREILDPRGGSPILITPHHHPSGPVPASPLCLSAGG